MKYILSILLLSVLMLTACAASETRPVQQVQNPILGPVEPVAPAPPAAPGGQREVPANDTQNTVEINMRVYNWGFDPSTIKVKQGDTVTINLDVESGTHTFTIKEYGLDVPLAQGDKKTITFVADKTGTFTYRCAVYCGDGHASMTGKLIVE